MVFASGCSSLAFLPVLVDFFRLAYRRGLFHHLYHRMQPCDPVPGIADRELPAGRPGTRVATVLPGPGQPPRLVEVSDARGKAVAHGAADLDLGHVQPGAVLRGVVQLEALRKALGLLGRERLVRSHGVRV